MVGGGRLADQHWLAIRERYIDSDYWATTSALLPAYLGLRRKVCRDGRGRGRYAGAYREGLLVAMVSQDDLPRVLGCSTPQTAARRLDELVCAGWIERRAAGGPRTPRMIVLGQRERGDDGQWGAETYYMDNVVETQLAAELRAHDAAERAAAEKAPRRARRSNAGALGAGHEFLPANPVGGMRITYTALAPQHTWTIAAYADGDVGPPLRARDGTHLRCVVLHSGSELEVRWSADEEVWCVERAVGSGSIGPLPEDGESYQLSAPDAA